MNIQPLRKLREPYGLDLRFERALVLLLTRTPRLWDSIGYALDEECFAQPESKLAVQAIRAIVSESDKPPASSLIVLQRLRRLCQEGKVTNAEVIKVSDFIDDAESDGGISVEAAVAEITPILQRRAQRAALESGLQAFQKRGDPTEALRQLEQASKIGLVQTDSIGSVFGPASLDDLVTLQQVQRLKTGVMELDDALKGGVQRRTLNMFIGGSGGGKSMGLVQVAAAAIWQGFHVGYASLELDKETINARLIANITGFAIDDIFSNPKDILLQSRLGAFLSRPGLGKLSVKEFTPKATTVGGLLDWVGKAGDTWGQAVDVLVVDYADKVAGAGGKKGNENTYTTQGNVYDELFTWARDNNKWAWTASQGKRRGDKHARGQRLDLDDVADSMNKVRAADTVITLNMEDDLLTYYLAKNRKGKGQIPVGPLPTDFACARISPVNW